MKRFYYEQCDSTSLRAKEYFENHTKNRVKTAVFIANEQTNGKGRQGKSFYSPKGTGLYLTFGFYWGRRGLLPSTLTTNAACAVCRAIEKVTKKQVQIKWVNDIYLQDKKIGGILCQNVVAKDSDRVEYILIGIGLNLTTTLFPKELEKTAASLGYTHKKRLYRALKKEFVRLFKNPQTTQNIEYYKSRSLVLGKQIYCIQNGKKTPCTALDIAQNGGLIVQFEDGKTETLTSGEVTVRFVENSVNNV